LGCNLLNIATVLSIFIQLTFTFDKLFLISLLQILLPFLYFCTIWAYAKTFFSNLKTAERWSGRLLISTLITHATYIVVRSIEFQHPPITSIFEILSLIAFTVLVTYTYIELRTKNVSTGYFILMLPFCFQLVSSIFIKEATEVPAILRSNLLGFHVLSALLGYGALTISAVYGFLYLMLYHDIKSREFSVIYKRLPNLEVLERMSFTATVFGFVLLSIAIIVGSIWLPRVLDTSSFADPKLLGTFVIWLIYAGGLVGKAVLGLHGRRMVVLSMFGFALAMFSLTIVNMFFSGFHKFY